MKVLHIGEYVQGGVATYLKLLFSADGQDDVENYLVLSSYKSEHKWNLPNNRLKYYKYKRSVINVFPAMLEIYRHIKKVNPDVIYCHSTWAGLMGRMPYLLCKKKLKIIYNAHGWSFNRDTSSVKKKIYAAVERRLAVVTDKIINVSRYEMDSAVDFGLPQEKMQLVYSGISADKPRIGKKVEMYTDKINLLFVGRFDPQKGLDFLLNTFDKYANELQHIHLWVIGDNVVSDGNGISKENTDNTTFLGWVSHEDISAYYEACDAVIMPSRWEAFGLVAIEAMKYGKPVIASNRGALPELIQDGVNGWIFDMDDEIGLVKLVSLITKKKCKDMEMASRKVLEERFSLARMGQDIFAVYLE